LKLVYVCECCDSVIKEVVLPAGLPENAPNLTGSGLRDIMDLDGGEGEVVLSDLCDDCREILYGGPESTYFSGPVLH
jgi:hypothetical protein